MATEDVTGKTEEQLEEMRAEFQEKPRSDHYDFEERYCLAKIPKQPPEYDGPPRYCAVRRINPPHYLCKNHGGAEGMREKHVTNLKHGMDSQASTLLEHMEPEEEQVYEWVMEEFPRAYDIDLDADPLAKIKLRRYAVELVRKTRGTHWALKEGEKDQRKIINSDGDPVIDPETGEFATEDSEHYLASMLQSQERLLSKMEKDLGIDRKSRLQREENASSREVMQEFMEVGASLMQQEDQEYNPDEFDPEDET